MVSVMKRDHKKRNSFEESGDDFMLGSLQDKEAEMLRS